jgi:ABC-type Na+ efflux pump permease subunit
MNRAIFLATVRERINNSGRMVLLGLFVLLGVLEAVQARTGGGAPGHTLVVYLALVLGSGLIGTDVSAGVLHLLFLRPVSRMEYVLSKWLAVSAGCAVVAFLRLALYVGILSLGRSPVDWDAVTQNGLDCLLVSFGVSAVLACFSALGEGYADLRIYLLVFLLGVVLQALGGLRGEPWWDVVARQIYEVLVPRIDLGSALDTTATLILALVSYLSTVSAAVTLAVVAVNRRELSYAAG